MAATLLILRAGEQLGGGPAGAAAIGLYAGYNATATLTSLPAGQAIDRLGATRVFALGVVTFGLAYLLLAVGGDLRLLGMAFVMAGVGIACVETSEHAVVAQQAPEHLRGSAFGLLAATQSAGNFAASTVVGLFWTFWGPGVGFAYASMLMALSLGALVVRRPQEGKT